MTRPAIKMPPAPPDPFSEAIRQYSEAPATQRARTCPPEAEAELEAITERILTGRRPVRPVVT